MNIREACNAADVVLVYDDEDDRLYPATWTDEGAEVSLETDTGIYDIPTDSAVDFYGPGLGKVCNPNYAKWPEEEPEFYLMQFCKYLKP